MNTQLFLKTTLAAGVAATLTAGAWAQVSDASKATENNPAQSAQSAVGRLGTRDMNGTVKAKDGILKVQGSTMYLKSGKLTRVDRELKLSEGITAEPSGEVTLSDGRKVTLQEGQMVTLDGNLIQAPQGLGSTARDGSSSTQPPTKGDLTDFGNSGVTGPQEKSGNTNPSSQSGK